MKPNKKAKGLPLISKARRESTRRMLSLWDQAERAERTLYDAEAVAEATKRFLEQAHETLVAAAGVSAKERAEAVFNAAKKFWEQSTSAVSDAQQALDAARDALFAYNDKRVALSGEASAEMPELSTTGQKDAVDEALAFIEASNKRIEKMEKAARRNRKAPVKTK